MLRVLILGDIMGSIGRKALAKKLPELRKKYDADFVIANCENLAHGMGVTSKTFKEIIAAGVDFCTAGNHIWDKKNELKLLLADKDLKNKLVRPANYKKIYKKLGEGYKIVEVKGKKILVINLTGRIFMKNEEKKMHPPLLILEEILETYKRKKLDAIFLDLHAEATSEKRGIGWFCDGRATLVWGTHTHIPTADAQILPNGTGYITDLGMVGARDSVIGEEISAVVNALRRKDAKIKHEIPEKGYAVIQGIYAEIEDMKTKKIKQILEETKI